jgi:tetratricopeptide (TPR) repeat protein
MLAKLNKITSRQAAFIIAILGFAVFFTGLHNPFMGDDSIQIVNNVPVHSITNMRLFFEGGTFYNGHGLAPLGGVYYRPLMTTVFSLLYTLFGAHPIAFHLFQLLLCIGSAIILYLFFRFSFKPALALLLSLVFLLHPIDSQVVFAIPQMQDALFFFFGILALWLLLRFSSVKSLSLVAVCLLLSLLSKETGILFVAMSLLYLFWWDRKRFYPFIGIITLPVVLWLVLKINAVGLDAHSINAPIDSLNLWGRLLTAPSIMLFFIAKFLFPVKLASGYYWVHSTFTFRNFLLPLAIDLAVVALIVYLAFVIRKRAPRAQHFTFLFFATWSALGLLAHLQIIPLDMTASETWFYLSMAGVLGMIGVAITTLGPSIRLNRRLVFALMMALIVLFGVRTAIRGTDWSSQYSLAKHDIAASREDYVAEKDIAIYYFDNGYFSQAKVHATRSVDIFPNAINYNTLGQSLAVLGDSSGAAKAFTAGMKYQDLIQLYENMAALTAGYGNPSANKEFLLKAVNNFPRDANIWLYLAVLDYRNNDIADAKTAISQAYEYGQSSNTILIIYNRIMNNQPLNISFNPNPYD